MVGWYNEHLVGSIRKPFFHNIGWSYSSPTFTIHGADGRALSSTNPAWVTLPHPTNTGEMVTIRVTENKTMEDAGGTFDFGTQTMETTASIAWSFDMPLFVYAIINDAATSVTFGITRKPNAQKSPASSNLYQKGDSGGTSKNDMWVMDSGLTLTNWDSNPCLYIGYITATKDTSDNWTIVLVNSSTQITAPGTFPDAINFSFPKGQNGAVSSSFFSSSDALDTMPAFSNNFMAYKVFRDGDFFFTWQTTTCTSSGVNNTTGGQLRIHMPISILFDNFAAPQGIYRHTTAGTYTMALPDRTSAGTIKYWFLATFGGVTFTPATITTAQASFLCTGRYRAF